MKWFSGDGAALRALFDAACMDIVEQVGTTRAAVWFFSLTGDELVCETLYDRQSGQFTAGLSLRAAEHPAYFKSIRSKGRVSAEDALANPATASFADTYFRPNNIRSLLDHVVVADGEPVAVLCCEHCHEVRRWTPDDAHYLREIADLLGEAFRIRVRAMGGR